MKDSAPRPDDFNALNELGPLLEAVKSVLEFESFPQTARQIFLHAKKLTGATAGYVALLSKDGRENEVLFLDAGGTACTVDPALPMPVRGLRAEAYRLKEPVYDNDFTRSQWAKFLPAGHAPLKNVLFAPLVIHGAPVGLLGLANKPSGFTDHDKSIAKALGDFAALALLNSRNLDSLRNLNEAREKSLSLVQITQNFLKIANEPTTLAALLPAFIGELQKVTRCGTAGIRLVYKGGAIPFQAHVGFSEQFLELESPLSLRADNCLCSRVLRGELNGLEAHVTIHGSFMTNNLRQAVEQLPKEASKGLRKNCCQFGFASLALVPIRFGGKILGLFYVADLREDSISPEIVSMIENIGLHLGPAIKRFQIEEDLRERSNELERANRELWQSNKELEQFAFAASHDLQEPLRMVTSFTQLLTQRYLGKLDAEADKIIGQVTDGANRMSRMISGILEYSTLQSQAFQIRVINLNEVLEKVLANLASSISETGAIVTRDSLPPVRGDDRQLALLFQHLLANAIKFRKETGGPRIHVGSLPDKQPDWHFFVRDDGIGIDPKYFGKLFFLFRRLHGAKDYPGTGIGLALCKKIVEHHRGQIWVESTLDKGSTFHFTIPKLGSIDHHELLK